MINSGGPLHQAGEFRGLCSPARRQVGRIRQAFLKEVAPAQRPERGVRLGQAKWRGRQAVCGVRRSSTCKGLEVRGRRVLQELKVQERSIT